MRVAADGERKGGEVDGAVVKLDCAVVFPGEEGSWQEQGAGVLVAPSLELDLGAGGISPVGGEAGVDLGNGEVDEGCLGTAREDGRKGRTEDGAYGEGQGVAGVSIAADFEGAFGGVLKQGAWNDGAQVRGV